ncbi:MAG: alpha/beta fold hydrolase [Desulfuromonadales bacterium]
MHLFCLPHAGGSGAAYRALSPHLAKFIRLRPLEFPGRGRRLSEPLLHDLPAVVEDLCRQIACFDGPYAIYGHSMGALAGCLLANRLAALGRPLPCHLFVSGRKSPAAPKDAAPISRLPRDAFLDRVIALGGTPPEIAADRDFLYFIEPVLRADFAAVESYAHPPQRLGVPVSVLTGADEGRTEEDVRLWRQTCGQDVQFFDFPGGHFFLFAQWPQIGRLISNTLHPHARLSRADDPCVNA